MHLFAFRSVLSLARRPRGRVMTPIPAHGAALQSPMRRSPVPHVQAQLDRSSRTSPRQPGSCPVRVPKQVAPAATAELAPAGPAPPRRHSIISICWKQFGDGLGQPQFIPPVRSVLQLCRPYRGGGWDYDSQIAPRLGHIPACPAAGRLGGEGRFCFSPSSSRRQPRRRGPARSAPLPVLVAAAEPLGWAGALAAAMEH